MIADRRYWQVVTREAEVIVPEGELKWASLAPVAGVYRDRRANLILRMAESARLKVRGHALMWHQSIPQWAEPVFASGSVKEVQELLATHVRSTAFGWQKRIFQWDVVNEALDVTQPDGMRMSPFSRRLGSAYIDAAFRIAHEADPYAELFYNDYGFEQDGGTSVAKRGQLLRLIDRLRANGTPIHGVGLQCHLRTGAKFDASTYAGFLAQLRARNLKIVISEMDIADKAAPADEARRDREICALATDFLDCVLAEPNVAGVTTWGVSSLYSALNDWGDAFRDDGLSTRGLPYDSEFRETGLRAAMADAFTRAAPRNEKRS